METLSSYRMHACIWVQFVGVLKSVLLCYIYPPNSKKKSYSLLYLIAAVLLFVFSHSQSSMPHCEVAGLHLIISFTWRGTL